MRSVLSLLVVSAVALSGYLLIGQQSKTSEVAPADGLKTGALGAQPQKQEPQPMPHGAVGMTAVLDADGQRYLQQGIAAPNNGLDPAIVNTSTDGLELEQDPQGRGFYMNLQGRFQSAIVATIDDQGNLTTDCVPTDPAAIGDHVHQGGTP